MSNVDSLEQKYSTKVAKDAKREIKFYLSFKNCLKRFLRLRRRLRLYFLFLSFLLRAKSHSGIARQFVLSLFLSLNKKSVFCNVAISIPKSGFEKGSVIASRGSKQAKKERKTKITKRKQCLRDRKQFTR